MRSLASKCLQVPLLIWAWTCSPLNPTNAVGGSFILSLQRDWHAPASESHQRSWWIVHIQPCRSEKPSWHGDQPLTSCVIGSEQLRNGCCIVARV